MSSFAYPELSNTWSLSRALSGEQGVKVIIHPPNTQPVPTGEGYTLAPGFSSNIGDKLR